MKIKHFITGLALAMPAIMAAVPADPRPRILINPDGSTIEVRVHGDEYFSFMTDTGCSRILERDSRGFIVDAVRDGNRLAFNRENVEMLKAQAFEANPLISRIMEFEAEKNSNPSGMQRMASLNTEGRSNYPTIGEGNRSLVVLVEFEDVSFTVANPKDYFTRQLNEPGFSDYGGYGSAVDYYKDASNGLYVPQFDVYGPVKIDKEASFFYDRNSKNKKMDVLIKKALTALHEEGEVDFSNYDLDEDGTVDTVFFYYAGYGSADSETETIWPHQGDYRWYASFGSSLRFDGKVVGPYACANELKGWNPQNGYRYPWRDGSEPWVDGIGTFCHEYGHVLGLPDMYDVNYDDDNPTVTPGQWDVMDQGSYNFEACRPPLMSAYEQWVCRWLEFEDAVDGTSYQLDALGNSDSPYAVRIQIPSNSDATTFQNEYFVIEARDNSKWDSIFPEPGLMVWRINYNKNIWSNNSVNTGGIAHVEIIYADDENYPLYADGNIYPGGPNELIPSKEYKFWNHPYVTSMAYDPESKTGSFDYNVITEAPTGAPVLHDNPYADLGTARNFTLEWDPVEGADSYRVTIKRVSNGKVLGLYDEFDVGNVTQCKVVSVPTAYWNNEIEVYVRAVKLIPCSDKSNVISFIPSELQRGAAVEGIDADSVSISGGVGCIHAPEGAVVYDLTGKSLQKENLTPGIYIVSYGEKTVKVTVR